MKLTTLYRYPSLLESSDADGGSSVAVLTYLRRILDALDHPELIHMILQYLLALQDRTSASPTMPRSPAAVKRRQSLMLLNTTEQDDEKLNPSLFNLVDLVLGSTGSANSQTVVAALKLATVVLSKNHGYALGSMIKVINVHHNEPYRTVGALNIELETYLNLAIHLAGEDGVDESYDNHLKDILSMLESHPCSLKTISQTSEPLQSSGYFDSSESAAREVAPHYLIPEDPLFKSLMDLLLWFLTNDVETNLALTETIVSLGTCSQLCLEGWLSVDPADYHFEANGPEPAEFSNENFRDMYKANRFPTWSPSATPQLLACLQQLEAQVEALHADIQDWDQHITNRKNIFRSHEQMDGEMKGLTPQPKSNRQPSETGTSTPQIPKHVLDNSATPPRTQSPRGRKETFSDHRNVSATSPAPSKFGGQTLVGSPSRAMSPIATPQAGQRTTTHISDADANMENIRDSEVLKRRIRFRRQAGSQTVEVMLSKYLPPPKDPSDDVSGDVDSEQMEEDIREASLMHIVTNVVLLQEFVLELVALLQVRASLFNEIRFT